jgi:hypothetical protein
MDIEEKIMRFLADFIIRRKKIIPVIAVVLLVLSIFAAGRIRVTTQMKDLLPEDNPQVEAMEEVNDVFAGGNSLIITIKGEEREQMEACAEEMINRIKTNESLSGEIRAIGGGTDKAFLSKWGLLLQEAEDLTDNRKRFANLNLLPFVTGLNDEFEKSYTGMEAEEEIETVGQERQAVEALTQIERLMTGIRYYLEKADSRSAEQIGKSLAEQFMFGDRFPYSLDNRMLLFNIYPDFPIDEIDTAMVFMREIDCIRKELSDAYSGLTIGYTGNLALNYDEQNALSMDMIVPVILAFILVLFLVLFSFNRTRAVVFSIVSLAVGIVITYGVIGISFGKITMLTSVMGAVLIGLGIDYAIQIIVNFSKFRSEGAIPPEALRLTFTRAGMGNALAALTTATAFIIMGLTGTRALAEFGFIAGIGIAVCFLSIIFLLPSLLLLFGKKGETTSRIPTLEYGFLSTIAQGVKKNRIPVFILAVVVTGIFGYLLTKNTLLTDIMKLEPQGSISVKTHYKVLEAFHLSPDSSLYIADSIEEAEEITALLEEERSVGEISSISYFIPSVEEQNERLDEITQIRSMGPRFKQIEYTAQDVVRFAEEVQRLEWNIIELADISVAGLGEDNLLVKKRNHMIREIFGAEVGKTGEEVFQKLIKAVEKDPEITAGKLSALDMSFAETFDGLITEMAGVRRKITIDDLPDSISRQMLSGSGEQNLITVFPKPGITDNTEEMESFAADLAAVASEMTGVSQVLLAWRDEVVPASKRSAVFIFIVVFIFTLISFRSIKLSLFACIPFLLGLVWMMGIYPLLGWQLNLFNVALIPLIIGMGIGFGIHIVHRYSVEGDIKVTYVFTGKAVWLSALTTMIGFGALGFAGSFAMIASIGRILFLGITAVLAVVVIILPAFLSFVKTENLDK